MSYSPLFQTLHDETRPVGNLGRGTHYSVLRAPVWYDKFMNRLKHCEFLDFAIIWDEDHNIRIIDVIIDLHTRGLLSPVRYIGERKGMLTVLLAPDVVNNWELKTLERYCNNVSNVCNSPGNNWSSTVCSVDTLEEHSIIQAGTEHVTTYLKNINILWDLGIKPKIQT